MEKEPLEDFSITHTICKKCVQNKVYTKKADENILALKSFFNEVLHSAEQGEKIDVQKIIDRGHEMNIAPLDLFHGIIQPILRELGNLYQKGEITVYKEHMFTSTSDYILHELDKKITFDNHDHSLELDVLLTCPEGNIHYLGVRSIYLFLKSHGYRCEVIYPGVPYEEILTLIAEKRPKVLGLTFSLENQLIDFCQMQEFIQLKEQGLPIILGGSLFRESKIQTKIPTEFHVINRVDELLQFLKTTFN